MSVCHRVAYIHDINPFLMDTPRGVSNMFENNFINNKNNEKYFTESCSECSNNQFFLNLFIKPCADSPRFNEQIQKNITWY